MPPPALAAALPEMVLLVIVAEMDVGIGLCCHCLQW
jgi:hypothetical protein